jgi:catechol 2,3-dioxygenase-like lactoylglutathione lyase family enzyme
MFDHVGLRVSDYARSRQFYETILAPLGITLQKELTPAQTGGPSHCGFGNVGAADFWIGTDVPVSGPLHIAFAARDRAAVRAFHAAAIGIGAPDNGAPGLRPIYHPDYYGAFVLDPDGNNIEAVCHLPA